MKIAVSAVIVLISLNFLGCAQMMVKDVTLKTKFDPVESIRALKPGNNTIKGSAVLLRNDGAAVTCAGKQVDLIPVTEYSTERMLAIYKSTTRGFVKANPYAGQLVNFTNNDASFEGIGMRKVVGDAQGFFTFDNVKDGEYYITTSIVWKVNQYSLEGGGLMLRVSVSGGQVANVVLSPHY